MSILMNGRRTEDACEGKECKYRTEWVRYRIGKSVLGYESVFRCVLFFGGMSYVRVLYVSEFGL